MLSKATQRPSGRSRILAAVLARFATAQHPWRAWPYKYPRLAHILAPAADLLDIFADFPSEMATLMSKLENRARLQQRRDRPAATTHPVYRFADFAWGIMLRWSLDHYSESPAHHECALRELFAIQGIELERDKEEWLYLVCTLGKVQPQLFLRCALDTPVDAIRTVLVRERDRVRKQDWRREFREWIPDDPEFLDVGYNIHSDDSDEKRPPKRLIQRRWFIARYNAAEEELDQIIETEMTKSRWRLVRAALDELARDPLPVAQRHLLEHWRAGWIGKVAAESAATQAGRAEKDWKVIHQELIRKVQRRLAAGQD